MITIRNYLDLRAAGLLKRWFESLNTPATAEVATALVRIEHGNFSNTGVSAPASMNTGSNSAPDIDLLLEKMETRSLSIGGGTKKHQNMDILAADECWSDYKERKAGHSHVFNARF